TRLLLARLESDEPERRKAAGLVIGELQITDARVLKTLGKMAASGDRDAQWIALGALEGVKSPATIRALVPLLEEDEDLRRRTEDTLAAFGPQVVAPLRRAALKDPANTTRRRRSIIGIIARAGGRRSAPALLEFLSDPDLDVARIAGLTIRHGLDTLKPKEKTDLLRRIQALIKRVPRQDPTLPIMAVDLLASFNQASAKKSLMQLARKGYHPNVRRAALLGLLRHAQGKRTDPALVRQLIATLSEVPFQPVPSTALDLLYRTDLGREYERDCIKLVGSIHFPVRAFALRKLAAMETQGATRTLIATVGTEDPKLRQVALGCLQKLGRARKLLLEGFLKAKNPAAAGYFAAALEPHRERIPPAARQRIVAKGWKLWQKGDPLAGPTLRLGRGLDPKRFHKEALKTAQSLKRARKYDKLAECLRMAARTDFIDDDLRFDLAIAELKLSPRETGRAARAADPALDLLGQLLDRPKFPLLQRIRKEKTRLGPEDLFYLGFHFSELDGPRREFGGDVLGLLIKRSPRTRYGRAARNKLKLQGLA
ncbi:MAG: HEAT repeat domain-containing protein, partial [Myxococcota bacterium]